jgi:hypothetical protein
MSPPAPLGADDHPVLASNSAGADSAALVHSYRGNQLRSNSFEEQLHAAADVTRGAVAFARAGGARSEVADPLAGRQDRTTRASRLP